jgi:hypothetical protein
VVANESSAASPSRLVQVVRERLQVNGDWNINDWKDAARALADASEAHVALDALVDEHAIMEAALREIERWPAPIDGSKVRAIASAAIGRLSRV